jgi:L-seryl-tRNA(Ser) seleniumtransferase
MSANGAGLRALPSVDRLLAADGAADLIAAYGRGAATDALRAALDDARARLLAGDDDAAPGLSVLVARASEALASTFDPTLRVVVNATGVIVHTNLGRALLSDEAQAAVQAVAGAYNTLEYDLAAGARGSRYVHAERLLTQITGAEAALVVNNNAAATVLVLAALAGGREVVLSRGQLVEIGGGFRVPEIMQTSGALLVEVGTTNRTHPHDYERAIGEATAMLLRVHRSNFRQEGFVADVALAEMAAIAHARGILLVDDLGSGTLLDTAVYGLPVEPTVQDSLRAGADLVTFSGDKLLGGPQAGILAGRADLIASLKAHPLARAFRADKLGYAALNATLLHYIRDEAAQKIPVWRMIARPLDEIAAVAERWAAATGGAVVDARSTVGGGSLPGSGLPTRALALDVAAPQDFLARLRAADPPIIARVEGDRVLLDPRTVLPVQEAHVEAVLRGMVG